MEHFARAPVARVDREVDAEGGRILWGLGRAQAATASGVDEWQFAWDTLASAFDYYDRAGDVEAAVNFAHRFSLVDSKVMGDGVLPPRPV